MEGRESRARGAGSHDAARAAQSTVKGRQERRAEPPRHPAIPCLHPEEVSAHPPYPTPLPLRQSRQPGRGDHPGVCRGERSAWTTMPRGREEAGRPAGRSAAGDLDGVMLREPSQSRRTNSARFHPRELLKTGKFIEAERNGGFQGLGSGDRGSNQQAWRFG